MQIIPSFVGRCNLFSVNEFTMYSDSEFNEHNSDFIKKWPLNNVIVSYFIENSVITVMSFILKLRTKTLYCYIFTVIKWLVKIGAKSDQQLNNISHGEKVTFIKPMTATDVYNLLPKPEQVTLVRLFALISV